MTYLWLSFVSKCGCLWKICGKVHAYVFVCPSVCVLPPNPENRHSSAEDLPTKFTKGYWERPERTENLCTEWMWPWEVWERHGLRNITKLLLKSPIGRKPSIFNIAWGWPYVAFDRQSQTPHSSTTVHSVGTQPKKCTLYDECHFSHPKYVTHAARCLVEVVVT